MRSTILYSVAAFAAFANARALTGLSYDKRHAFGTTGQCAVQPLGSGPATTNPDTADAFLANSAYDNGANLATTPKGWTLAYQDLKAASTTGGYLGFEELSSYDTAYCAAQCCNSWPGCKSFNIYYERNPTLDPADACPNPASTTRIKCSFWSQSLSSADATNDGQYCSDFHVVIAGSNAYNGGCAVATTTTAATTTAATTPAATTSAAAATTTSRVVTTTSAAPTVPTPGTPIQSCPVPETTYTATDGSKWAICKGSDFQGNTYKNVNNINSNTACADACSVNSGCLKSVFDIAGKVCYLKNGSLNWQSNPKYDTIRQIAAAPAPSPPVTTPTPTPTPANWNTWSQPKAKTCFLWICW